MNLARAVKTAFAAVAFALCVMSGSVRAAEDDQAPSTFVNIKFEGACDAQNNRLWLSNTHTYKTVAVTLRWKAAGGKDLVEQFFLAPNTTKEIGCAAEAAVADVMFADF